MNNLLRKKTNELTKKKKKGFTLVELIIVIAVIAILAAIAIPKFGEIRENANVKADIANAKNIQTAVSAAVSNGDVALGATNVSLSGVINGGTVPKPKASGHTGEVFNANVSATGEITVFVGTTQVLPTPASPYTS